MHISIKIMLYWIAENYMPRENIGKRTSYLFCKLCRTNVVSMQKVSDACHLQLLISNCFC